MERAVQRAVNRIVPGVVLAVALASCVSTSPAQTISSAPSATASSRTSESAAESPAESQPYTTIAFAMPLTVTVGPLLKSPPSADDPNLVSWDAASSDNEKVRFLIPVELYQPGSSKPQAPPRHYVEYLQGLAGQGAAFSKVTTIRVGAYAATVMTATTTRSMDGSLGCAVKAAAASAGCFGLQPEFNLRIAVIEVSPETTFVAWARTEADAPDPEFDAMFEAMLASVKFS